MVLSVLGKGAMVTGTHTRATPSAVRLSSAGTVGAASLLLPSEPAWQNQDQCASFTFLQLEGSNFKVQGFLSTHRAQAPTRGPLHLLSGSAALARWVQPACYCLRSLHIGTQVYTASSKI